MNIGNIPRRLQGELPGRQPVLPGLSSAVPGGANFAQTAAFTLQNAFLLGGDTPAITQETLPTFTKEYDSFRTSINESVPDGPISGVPDRDPMMFRPNR